jgi:hypothetical protein
MLVPVACSKPGETSQDGTSRTEKSEYKEKMAKDKSDKKNRTGNGKKFCKLQFLDFEEADPKNCQGTTRKKIWGKQGSSIQPYCVGFRGNGDRVVSHMSVAARLIETLGPFAGQA